MHQEKPANSQGGPPDTERQQAPTPMLTTSGHLPQPNSIFMPGAIGISSPGTDISLGGQWYLPSFSTTLFEGIADALPGGQLPTEDPQMDEGNMDFSGFSFDEFLQTESGTTDM
jgi:hypothetical protein